MPIYIFALIAFLSCLIAPSKSVANNNLTAKGTIEAFYREYLDNPANNLTAPPFSRAFLAESKKNDEICAKFSPGALCGWQADADPYINAQDCEANLSYKRSGIVLKEQPANRIIVTLNLFPSDPVSPDNFRTINYHMIQEDGKWVVDDIDNARAAMRDENASYLKKIKH